MARRKKDDGLLELVVALTAKMPWWVGVLLAVVSYLWLHSVAIAPPPTITSTKQIASAMTGGLWRGLAMAGQYILPILFCAGAFASAVARQQAKRLHAEAAHRDDGIAQMSWREFEVLVGEYFRRQDFAVTQNGGGGPDGGVDLLLKKGSDRYLVQCKHWRALRVGVEPVREMYGLMAAQRVAGGFVVTSGEFTSEAHKFAEGREIRLVNGKELKQGVKGQAQMAGGARSAAAEVPSAKGVARNDEPPLCPLCGAGMMPRKATRGENAGKSFWGCSRYAETKCRGTRMHSATQRQVSVANGHRGLHSAKSCGRRQEEAVTQHAS